MARRGGLWFGVRSAVVWVLMVVVLVVVPDTIERWMPLHIARACGWVLASGLWIAILERDWQQRFKPFPRFGLQVAVWLAAVLTATWISDQIRV